MNREPDTNERYQSDSSTANRFDQKVATLLQRLPTTPHNRLTELLPDGWFKTRPQVNRLLDDDLFKIEIKQGATVRDVSQ